jgi:hypothetical protein
MAKSGVDHLSQKKRESTSESSDSSSENSDSVRNCEEEKHLRASNSGRKGTTCNNHKKTGSYSDSWGIGSQLPSDDTSIKQIHHPKSRPASAVSKGLSVEEKYSNHPSQSSQQSIMKMSTHWDWNVAENGHEQWTRSSPSKSKPLRGPHSHYQTPSSTSNQVDNYSTTLSPHWKQAYIPPSRPFKEAPSRSSHGRTGSPRAPFRANLAVAATEARVQRMPTRAPESKNTHENFDSLEHMLAEYDQDAAFYDSAFPDPIDEGLLNLEGYTGDEEDNSNKIRAEIFPPIKAQHLQQTNVHSTLSYTHDPPSIHDSNTTLCVELEDEGPTWVTEDTEEIGHACLEWREEDDEVNYQQLDAFAPSTSTHLMESFQEVSIPDERSQSDVMFTPSDSRREDLLPLSRGKLLLMGLEQPGLSQSHDSYEANRAPVYGQSIRDIEVAVGQGISYHW